MNIIKFKIDTGNETLQNIAQIINVAIPTIIAKEISPKFTPK